MRLFQSCILFLLLVILSPHLMAQHNPEMLLYRRTDNLPGADFTGDLPTNVDREAPFGELDDPSSSLISALDVDREPGTEINLLGDNYDLAFIFQFYDEDGVFTFTENFDDRVKVVATPITGSANLTSTGAPFEHTDVSWNTRTFGNFDFSAEGSFSHNWPMWETVIAMMAGGQLDVTPALGGIWPLDEWHHAFETMHNREIVKAVLTPLSSPE